MAFPIRSRRIAVTLSTMTCETDRSGFASLGWSDQPWDLLVCQTSCRSAVGAPPSWLQRLAAEQPSWNQFKSLSQARTDSYDAKVAPICRQNSVNTPPFGHCRYGAIDQAEAKPCKSCIQLQRSRDVGRERQFILVSRSRIENVCDQPSHGCAVLSKEVVNLRENEPRHDDRTRRCQRLLVLWKAWAAISATGECTQEPAGICYKR